MDSRQAYKEKYEAKIKEWGARIEGLKASAEKAQAQAKIDFAAHVNGAHKTYETAKAKLEHIAHATDEKWHDVRKDADKAWHDVEQSLEGALAAAKSHVSPSSKKTE